ncbi:MAG: response regulator [Pirellulales bacterium]
MSTSDPLFDIFREEAREHLGALERGFLDLEVAEADTRRKLVDNLFRHAHSLKGDAKAVGLPALQQTSQVLEDVLEGLRAAPEEINRERIDQGLSQLDLVRQAFETWQQESEMGDEPVADLAAAAPPDTSPVETPTAAVVATAPIAAPAAPSRSPPSVVISPPNFKPPPAASENASTASGQRDENFTVRVPSERLDRMLNLAGEVRVSHRNAAGIQDRLASLFESLDQLPLGSRRKEAASDRELQQLRGELASWKTQMTDQLRHVESELRKKSGREELLVESLEADIRQARLLPLVMLADSLRRSIRDLAQSLGKSIRYEVDVGKIMLDKAVIEALRDPLLHLIRNAADHGLETPDARTAAGKPPEGRIRLEASRRGELVAIEISDDGRGIDYDKIRERLRQRGEIEVAALLQLTPRELAQYLFQPGFSTAEAGEVSGRGVGLDVVQTEVQRLHGTLELADGAAASRRGPLAATPDDLAAKSSGTTFVITVPVTISTVRILTVLAGGQYYGIPTSSIIRTGSAAVHSLHELEGSLVLSVEGRPVRWVPLCDILGTTGTGIGDGAARPYLLVGHAGRQAAVVVDDLEDESEVLLKPLGFPLNGLPGVVGGAIRPDGAVQVVLDIAHLAFGQQLRTQRPTRQPRASGRIMIVDDSPTTRTMLRNFFTAAGYMVRTACDGVDALERLKSQLVDLVISDVEMPRMNGLDLTRQIKARLSLPVILVTGKEKEEHRREGLEAGADAYVVKSSFEGDGLLEVVKQFV